MKYSIIFILALSFFSMPICSQDKIIHVVLISASKQHIPEFTRKELRLLYLGYAIIKNQQKYEPLINASQKQIYNSFLQKIMYMSKKNYERQMMSRIFRQGGERPEIFNSRSDLISNLSIKKNRITFVTLEFARDNKNIQVVQQLW